MRRKFGKNGPGVGAMGLGCWAIGGPFEFDGRPAGWGEVDDGSEDERLTHSKRATLVVDDGTVVFAR
ncbi:MAG TPA: hypothetical protein VN178_10275 [Rubrobacter sp.]|jgi:aryl-alcohol dehydrogenase-like predicted oxidoreductase|nr:hypothetical protein [Rubrobacter sp.]